MNIKSIKFRHIKWTAFYTLVTLFSVLLLISGLLFTNTGNQLIISVVKPIEPRLTIDLEEGSFFLSPEYNEISWIDNTSLNLELKKVHYEFDWSCLLTSFCIKSLSSKSTRIVLFENKAQAAEVDEVNAEPFRLHIPLPIKIEQLSLENTYFEMQNVVIVDLKKIELTANARGADVITTSTAEGLTVTLPESKKTTEEPLNKKKPNQTISFPAILKNDSLVDVILPLDLELSEFILHDFLLQEGETPLFAFNKIESGLSFKQSLVKVSYLSLNLKELDLDLSGQINLIDRYPLSIKANGKFKNIAQLQPKDLINNVSYSLQGEGDLANLQTEIKIIDAKVSPKLILSAKTKIDLFSENLPHTLNLNWQNIRWPLSGKPQFKSKKGDVSSNGTLKNYKIKANADYFVSDITKGELSVNSQGDLKEVNLDSLLIKTFNGELKLTGLLNWENDIHWDGLLAINHIDLVDVTKDYQGVFSGEIKQSVNVDLSDKKETAWQFDFPVIDVDGSFMKNPFTLQGKVSGNNIEGVNVSDVEINNASNKFIINGLIAEKNNLKIDLVINDFSKILLESSGKITGEVLVKGPQDKLNIISKIEGKDLAFKNDTLKSLIVDADITLEEKPIIKASVVATNLFVSGAEVDTIKLNVEHKKNRATKNVKHNITLDIKSEIVTTDLVFNVEQTKAKWLTSLSSASIIMPHQSISLDQPFQMVLEKNDNISLTKHCWSTFDGRKIKSGSICLDKFNVGEEGDVELHINNYLLASLNPLLPREFNLDGSISSDAKINWKKNKHPNFAFDLSSKNMLVITNDVTGNKNKVIFPVETFQVNVKGAEKVNLNVDILSDDLLETKIQTVISPYKKTPLIDGSVKIQFPNLAPFSALIKQIEKLSGSINSNLKLSGPLKNPIVKGDINIIDIKVVSGFIPMRLQELNAKVNVNGTQAEMNGSFSTGDGVSYSGKPSNVKRNIFNKSVSFIDKNVKKNIKQIADIKKTTIKLDESEIDSGKAIFKGVFDWNKHFKGKVIFAANKMEIYEYGKLDFLVSPKLTLIIDKEIDLSGSVYINEGKVTVKDLPEGAVVVSKDVIVIDVEQETISTMLPLKINLKLDLGHRLKIEAMGLKTRVRGVLIIKKQKTKDLKLNGELRLVSGSYRALGQHLVLRKSRINFIGPADSPYISLEAIRDPDRVDDGVIAGVRVTGTPDNLELVIFSEPSMSQQDALSYITTGKSVEDSSGSSNSQIASLLVDLGGEQSSETLKNFGDTVGISDLSLSSQGFGDEQSVGVSGYIAPDVQLSYGVGIFDDFTIVAVRYELFKNFYIEASNGLYQAIDAYYNFDWD